MTKGKPDKTLTATTKLMIAIMEANPQLKKIAWYIPREAINEFIMALFDLKELPK